MSATESRRADQSKPSLTKRIMWGVDRFFARHSKVGDRTFFDNAEFDFVPAVEAGWRPVRAELDALLPLVDHMPNFRTFPRTRPLCPRAMAGRRISSTLMASRRSAIAGAARRRRGCCAAFRA